MWNSLPQEVSRVQAMGEVKERLGIDLSHEYVLNCMGNSSRVEIFMAAFEEKSL